MVGAAKRLRRPCANCPWRVDAPREHWDPHHFLDIWRDCQDDGQKTMLCHKSSGGRDKVPCQGWIRVLGFDAIGVRLLVMRKEAAFEEVADKDGPELFPTFTAMLQANKIPLTARSTALKSPAVISMPDPKDPPP